MLLSRLHHDLDHLARNLWWSWAPEAKALWSKAAQMLPEDKQGEILRNPVRLVQMLKRSNLESLEANPEFMNALHDVMGKLNDIERKTSSFLPISWKNPVAYFSMEFGVHESLPSYAGGLGILAGDHAKSASDEGVPLVGVGLLYKEGYFKQQIDRRGRHGVEYEALNYQDLPITPVKTLAGKDLRVSVEMVKRQVAAKVWKLQVGRTPIFLLDTDIPENSRADRSITCQLYGGSRENRIRQEVLLGIGGVRALRAMGVDPSVWHMNEGHVAFLTLERLAEVRRERDLDFGSAVELIASNTVFTTHTPVPEGNEVFDFSLAWRYLQPFAQNAGIPLEDYLALGREDSKYGFPWLSMTVLALRSSRYRNGVSALHGEVSRAMWKPLWPGFPEKDTPIDSITNGIHVQTWVAPEMDELYRKYLGQDWREHLHDNDYWQRAAAIPGREIWKIKQVLKQRMIDYIREREGLRLARMGMSAEKIQESMADFLNPNALTIGFARRFAAYKRANLLFHDLHRARKILTSSNRPVQIIFAGKAHPQDLGGQRIFNKIMALTKDPVFHGRVAVIENYDMEIARYLVQGVDLWLNNPRRPFEASGTSGQKVPINGGLNASILDGWWVEGYEPDTGWAFGKPEIYTDLDRQDREDCAAMYRVLEREIVPLYYSRNSNGVPADWMRMVKGSIAKLVPRFSTSRMVRDYAERFYLPAAANGKRVSAAGSRLAQELALWRANIIRCWPFVYTISVAKTSPDILSITVFLGSLNPKEIMCRDADGEQRDLEQTKTLAPGCYQFDIGLRKGEKPGLFRLFPIHSALVHRQELGLSIEASI